MSSMETWTPEQEAEYQRLKADFEALHSTRNRIETQNTARLHQMAGAVLNLAVVEEGVTVDQDSLAVALKAKADGLRDALKPFDPTTGETT